MSIRYIKYKLLLKRFHGPVLYDHSFKFLLIRPHNIKHIKRIIQRPDQLRNLNKNGQTGPKKESKYSFNSLIIPGHNINKDIEETLWPGII